MFRRAITALGLAAFAAYSYAAPITITQTYSNISYNDYGVTDGVGYGQATTGDWIFKGTVDSNAANTSPWVGIGGFGAYQLTKLTLTQASLGLFDIGITNAPVLMFFPDFFAFASDPTGGAPFAVMVYEPDHFAGAQTLDDFLSLITPTVVSYTGGAYSGFGPQWTGFALDDGRRLYGTAWGLGIPMVETATVPEPTSLALMLLALGVLSRPMRFRDNKR